MNNRRTIVCLTATLVITAGSGWARDDRREKEKRLDRVEQRDEKAARADMNKRLTEFNSLAERNEANMREALKAVSVETGVPESRVIEMHRQHPKVGPAHIMLACVMADKTKRAPEYYFDEKTRGGGDTGWTTIAHREGISDVDLDARLARLQRHVSFMGHNPNRDRQLLEEKEKRRL